MRALPTDGETATVADATAVGLVVKLIELMVCSIATWAAAALSWRACMLPATRRLITDPLKALMASRLISIRKIRDRTRAMPCWRRRSTPLSMITPGFG